MESVNKTFEEEAEKLLNNLITKGHYSIYAYEPNGSMNISFKEMKKGLKRNKYRGEKIPKSVKEFLHVRYCFTYNGVHFLLF